MLRRLVSSSDQFDSLLADGNDESVFLVRSLQHRFLNRSCGHVSEITEEVTQLFVLS